jgi:hypothetical protein
MVTLPPSTVTLLVMWSPGWTAMLTVTGAEGTSSYQAEYAADPLALQSASVPACSRLVAEPEPEPEAEPEPDIALGSDHEPESDIELALESAPPNPTQNEEKL